LCLCKSVNDPKACRPLTNGSFPMTYKKKGISLGHQADESALECGL